MSIFGNIQGASMSSGGPKLPVNFTGILEIVSWTFDPKAFHGAVCIAEMVVHETNMHAEVPVGFRPSWTANMKHANTLGNIKAFLGSCYGLDPKTQEAQINAGVTDAFAEAAIGPAQPVRGKFVALSTENHKTQKNFDFIKHFWSPTTKQFPSRINDQNVSPTVVDAPTPPAVAMPTMPGAFNPQGFVVPQTSNGFGAPAPSPFGAQLTAPSPWSPPAAAPSPFGAQQTAPSPFGAQPGGFGVPTIPMASMPSFPAASVPSLPQMGGMPGMPGMPQMPAAPPMVAPFPPAGWAKHPDPAAAAQGWYYNQANPAQMKTEADLRAGR